MKKCRFIGALCSAAIAVSAVPFSFAAEAADENITRYISDIKVVGLNPTDCKNEDAKIAAQNMLIDAGYTPIDVDLNKGCGLYSDYIYLGCKTTTNINDAIKDIIIVDKFISDPNETVKQNKAAYTLCPFDGGEHFKDMCGDLNSNAGGIDAHIFYTKDSSLKTAVTEITINGEITDSVSRTDLNEGAVNRDSDGTKTGKSVDKLYMHTVKASKKAYDMRHNTYVQVFDCGMTFDQADAYCQSLGGHLAEGTTADVNSMIKDLLSDGSRDLYWLSGNYINGKLSWLSGEQSSFTSWGKDQPSKDKNNDSVAIVNKNVGSIEQGKWININRSGKTDSKTVENLGFVCEWTPDSGEKQFYKGHAYQYFDLSMSWEDAEKYCESLGGHLVTITSAEEQEKVNVFLFGAKKALFWIGGKYENKKFSWVNSEVYNYNKLSSSQLTAADKTGKTAYPAIMNWGAVNTEEDGGWCLNSADFKMLDPSSESNDKSGKDNYGFICEWDDDVVMEFRGHKYMVMNYGEKSWEKCQSMCRQYGGHLVTINSEEEQDFVSKLALHDDSAKNYWTGGFINTEKEYEWVTGEDFDYLNKNNDIKLYNVKEDQHIYLEAETGKWINTTLVNEDLRQKDTGYIIEWDEGVGELYSYLDKDYQVFDISMTWEQAEAYCESLGGHLFVINDNIDQKDCERALAKGTKDFYWLGGKIDKDDELQWFGLTPTDYTVWSAGQPDFAKYGDCVLMYKNIEGKKPYTWGTADNRASAYGVANSGFICEWDKEFSGFASSKVDDYPVLTTTSAATTTTAAASTTKTTAATTKATTTAATKATTKATTAATTKATTKATTAATTKATTKATTATAAKATTTVNTTVPKKVCLIGDANCDGKFSVSDAVAVLQHVGNRDKYGLSEQGLINADVDGVAGVTAKDALVIQQVDAGIYKSEDLPLKVK